MDAARWACFARVFNQEVQRNGLDARNSAESGRINCGGALGSVSVSVTPFGDAVDCVRVRPTFHWNPASSSQYVTYSGTYCASARGFRGGFTQLAGSLPPPRQVPEQAPAQAERPPQQAQTQPQPAAEADEESQGLVVAEIRAIQRGLRTLQFASMEADGSWSTRWTGAARDFLDVYSAGAWRGEPDINLLSQVERAVAQLETARQRARDQNCSASQIGLATVCGTVTW